MRRGFRPPLALFAAALLGLIALLATLQYRWLGRISDAERERMRASLNARASEFAQDFDRELTQIGRASCRERVEISVGAVSIKKKNGNTIYRTVISIES